jgi:hypothetical protein
VKLPRDLSGAEITRVLQVLGTRSRARPAVTLRLTTTERGEHHVTVPAHGSLRIGTLAGILGDVAAHFELTRDELVKRLFDST